MLSIALAQMNPVLGDLPGNLQRIRSFRDQAAAGGADLVVFPELSIIGYPPEDLVLRPAVIEATRRALATLQAESVAAPAVAVGLPWLEDDRRFNAMALVSDGAVELRFKHELPNYAVFDEKRVFDAGPLPEPIEFRGVRLGLAICEDIWLPSVVNHLTERQAEVLIVPNGSPFDVGKPSRRLSMAQKRSRDAGLPLIYVNQVGGQDELVFDGGSFVIAAAGDLIMRAPSWQESLLLSSWERTPNGYTCRTRNEYSPESRSSAMYNALVVGLRDYAHKNGFRTGLVGMSGGIDSALTAAIAVDALGVQHVTGIRLPSQFTSSTSLEDAEESARLLGCQLETLPIEPLVDAALRTLEPLFAGRAQDVTEENLQSRVRAVLLMALSNKFGSLLLTTGNKSEMSVGYTTLYGDMSGGFSVLKDVYKTDVYHLARWRNTCAPVAGVGSAGPVVPESSLVKSPTAELRAGQLDQDTLPPYETLDDILRGLIEDELSVRQIADRGYAEETVRRVSELLQKAEYKRRQAPPGVKISDKSFGKDRRYPITNHFRDDSQPS